MLEDTTPIPGLITMEDGWSVEWVYIPCFDKVMFVCISDTEEVNDHPKWFSGFYWGDPVEEDTIFYAKRIIDAGY